MSLYVLSMCGAPWLVLPAAALSVGSFEFGLYLCCRGQGFSWGGGDRVGWTHSRATAVMTGLEAAMATISLFVWVSVYLWWLSDHVAKIFLC